MINLFHIPQHSIETSLLGNHLHGPVVEEFEKEFAEYVGAKYACTLNSATNAIYLILEGKQASITIPSMLPPVVYNAAHHAGATVNYVDNTDWVGSSYMLHDFGDYKVIDSAQRVDRDQFKEANEQDLMLFSFYPTKPVGGMDGGIIVSNDKDKIDYFKQRSLNGMTFAENNWDRKQVSIGWKMYMNSAQAYIALQNLRNLDSKKRSLDLVRREYNQSFGLENTSDHLYRVNVHDRDKVSKRLLDRGIATGIHYTPLHLQPLYESDVSLPRSEEEGRTTLSIPFNECLRDEQVATVVREVGSEL
jgi:dTDP-4-amino-4,6-dideoxygalactose transaminase